MANDPFRLSAVPILLAAFVLASEGCGGDGPGSEWHTTGERVCHATFEVTDVLPHRLESSEFVLHGAARAVAADVGITQRIVLVTDLVDWQGTADGYEERRYANGQRNLYRLHGTVRRWVFLGNRTVTRFELSAYDRGLSRGRSVTTGSVPPRTFNFWMHVDEHTGAAKIGPR